MKYFIYSENSILITINHKINDELILFISSIKNKIDKDLKEYLVEVVQSINSLLIIFDKNKISHKNLINKIKKIEKERIQNKVIYKIWEIPICYDLTYASDLKNFSRLKKITTDEVIQIHKSKIYNVISMGFLPGFMYLGQTDVKLHCERKEKPSINISKGSIGLALNQTCIYPQNSPGGWHIIGISPLDFFDINSKSPCFAKPGDKIQFVEISKPQYESMKDQNFLKPNFR